MADGLTAPDGMALACQTCGWRPDKGTMMGVVKAHFETEHDTDDVRLDLVVLCPRCDIPMRHDRTTGSRDFFSCDECFRARSVRRG